MVILKVIVCIAIVLIQEWAVLANHIGTHTQSSVIQTSDASPNIKGNRELSASNVLGSMYRKSRQSRCVRCYEDRFGYDDRNRGSYSSRSSDDRNWYYPSYDSDRSYPSNYRDRDDRYGSRPYDRYEARGYGAMGYGAMGYGNDRYGSDRYGSDRYGGERYSSDRYGGDRYGGDRYGSDRYGGDRYGSDPYADRYGGRDRYDDRRLDSYKGKYDDSSRDRYERPRERDYNDRYYSRYDFRNYRPWDETYRGQSGFDNSGRGYYFAGDDSNRDVTNSRRYLPETGRRCGVLVTNCPYDRNEGGTQTPPRPLDNNDSRYGNTNSNNGSNSNRNNGWNYMNEQDNQSQNHGGGGSSGNSGGSSNRDQDRDRDRDRDQDQNRNQQSSTYGSRSSRPIGGSYLFDRENNDVNSDTQTNGNTIQSGIEQQKQQQPRDEGMGTSAGEPQAQTMTNADDSNKQS